LVENVNNHTGISCAEIEPDTVELSILRRSAISSRKVSVNSISLSA
jgi:hypothetical protein